MAEEHYESWERRMNAAADSVCQWPDRPDSNSRDCGCPACRMEVQWSAVDGLERGLLFAGMVAQGFHWPEYPEPPATVGQEGSTDD